MRASTDAASPNWLVDQLPVGMLEDEFLVRFTSIFQDVADTLVHAVDAGDTAADLTLTPDPFVRWLGSWIDAYPHPGEAAQAPGGPRERAWIQAQARALAGRGTRPSLQLMLQELAGDGSVRVTDGGGVYRSGQCPPGDPAWLEVRMPSLRQMAPTDVLDLIRAEVPVHVAVRLLVDDVPVDAGARLRSDPADPSDPSDPSDRSGRDVDCGLETGGEPGLSRSVRRLPGTAGRAGQPFRACPVCVEHNRLGETVCWRCGSPLSRPAPAPAPEPLPDPVEASEPEFEVHRIWPVVLVLVAFLLVSALVAGAALLW